MSYWKHSSMACMIALAAAGGAGAAEFETPKNRAAKDVLPAAAAVGADYTVSDPVVADGYMYQFNVTSYTTKTHTTFGLNTETTYDWKNHQGTVPINATVAQLLKVGINTFGLAPARYLRHSKE